MDCNPCPHGKLKYKCADCNPCPHGKMKYICADCNPCPHGRLKHHCADCNPCPHGKVKSSCADCTPCPHGKLKRNCADCNLCPLGKLKRSCATCKPKRNTPEGGVYGARVRVRVNTGVVARAFPWALENHAARVAGGLALRVVVAGDRHAVRASHDAHDASERIGGCVVARPRREGETEGVDEPTSPRAARTFPTVLGAAEKLDFAARLQPRRAGHMGKKKQATMRDVHCPCPHGRVKYSCADCKPCPHGKLEIQLHGLQPLPAWQAETQLRDVQPHARMAS